MSCLLDEIKIGEGVILKSRLHSFCKDCIEETVEHSVNPQMMHTTTCTDHVNFIGACNLRIGHQRDAGEAPQDEHQVR